MRVTTLSEETSKKLPEESEAVRRLREVVAQRRQQKQSSSWLSKARPNQHPPDGDWFVAVFQAGRGWGKDYAGSGWIHHYRAMKCKRYIALVGKTPADVRDFMIEGPSGILSIAPEDEKPIFKPTNRSLEWPNGSIAKIFSSEEPDQLRGFSGDTAWLDEFAKYDPAKAEAVWENLIYGMREISDPNDRPRIYITTTGRAMPVFKQIKEREDTVVITGSSYENLDNLSKQYATVLHSMESSSWAKQEIHGGVVEEVAGALWSIDMIDRHRLEEIPWNDLGRIVVAIDPMTGQAGGPKKASKAETGIVVAAQSAEKDEAGAYHYYVLADKSMNGTPHQWASAAMQAYESFGAHRVVAEQNQGGSMIEQTIRSIDKDSPVKLVRASKGKVSRAEPVASIYETGRVHHCGVFNELEDQMTTYDPTANMASPDRMDALVWALTELSGRQRLPLTWGK